MLALNRCIHSVCLERALSFTVLGIFSCFRAPWPHALGLFWFQALEQLREGEGFMGVDMELLHFWSPNARKCQHLLQSDLAVQVAECKAVKFWVLGVVFLSLLQHFHHVASALLLPYLPMVVGILQEIWQRCAV